MCIFQSEKVNESTRKRFVDMLIEEEMYVDFFYYQTILSSVF